ncbi:HEPN domain-containing protein, partial [Endothiovibrio diazotrophicus]
QRNLTYWYNSASGFWRGTGYYMARDERAHAAFLLHQSVERYYHALTLVFTGDKHKTHDIRKLAEIGAELHPALVEAMPRSEAEEKARFDLLRRAYIEARYSKGYRITHEELETLREQVR